MDVRGIVVQIPAGEGDLSLLQNVQILSEAHLASF